MSAGIDSSSPITLKEQRNSNPCHRPQAKTRESSSVNVSLRVSTFILLDLHRDGCRYLHQEHGRNLSGLVSRHSQEEYFILSESESQQLDGAQDFTYIQRPF
ncbi:unnamed protein product [Pleuronectes platessa]|uniref:Uncharacterized protein n=1 Tax=Pleuronectes platessa TaxID=8262 RepID=A0A9N7VBF0_PLEPL|nr:unnamed protein product [Pleuronectes platessa]